MDVGMARLRLAGTDHTKLLEVGVGVDKHGSGLGGEDDGVLRSYAAGLRFADTLTLNHPEIGFLTAVIKNELVTAVERRQAVTFGLAVHNCAETLAIGGESDFIHDAKVHISYRIGK